VLLQVELGCIVREHVPEIVQILPRIRAFRRLDSHPSQAQDDRRYLSDKIVA
jgi:hypothetical protein